MSKPLIGITFHKKIKDVYSSAVTDNGGIPVYLGPCCEVDAIIPQLQGIVLSGGGDVWPGYFSEDFTGVSGIPDPVRDEFELELVQKAYSRSLPILGICRGIQVINIALGGTVFQDIGDSHFQTENPITPTHQIDILTHSKLYKIIQSSTLMVNSFHHQSVKDLAEPLTISAYSNDGIIEGVEAHNILGCQWHPEWLSHRQEETNLFSYFIEMCKEYHDNSQKSQTGKD